MGQKDSPERRHQTFPGASESQALHRLARDFLRNLLRDRLQGHVGMAQGRVSPPEVLSQDSLWRLDDDWYSVKECMGTRDDRLHDIEEYKNRR